MWWCSIVVPVRSSNSFMDRKKIFRASECQGKTSNGKKSNWNETKQRHNGRQMMVVRGTSDICFGVSGHLIASACALYCVMRECRWKIVQLLVIVINRIKWEYSLSLPHSLDAITDGCMCLCVGLGVCVAQRNGHETVDDCEPTCNYRNQIAHKIEWKRNRLFPFIRVNEREDREKRVVISYSHCAQRAADAAAAAANEDASEQPKLFSFEKTNGKW